MLLDLPLSSFCRTENRRQRRHAAVDLAPRPGSIAPDEAGAVAMPAGILRHHVREKFITRRDIRAIPPRGAATAIVPIVWCISIAVLVLNRSDIQYSWGAI